MYHYLSKYLLFVIYDRRNQISVGLMNALTPFLCQGIYQSNDDNNLCCMEAVFVVFCFSRSAVPIYSTNCLLFRCKYCNIIIRSASYIEILPYMAFKHLGVNGLFHSFLMTVEMNDLSTYSMAVHVIT